MERVSNIPSHQWRGWVASFQIDYMDFSPFEIFLFWRNYTGMNDPAPM
jgi:hypothetical protein